MDRVRFAVIAGLVISLAACGGGRGSSPPPNHPPTADAGTAQSAAKRTTVTLDGSASHDPDGSTLTYAWSQTAGTAVTLSSAAAAKPTFTAPTKSGALAFSLTVNDGQVSSPPSTVTITIVNSPPTASVGANAAVASGASVTLDGKASSDPDSDPLTY